MRRDGPELTDEKKTSKGRGSAMRTSPSHSGPGRKLVLVGDWYTIGLFVGLGTALGVAATGVLLRALFGLVVAAVIIVAIGFAFAQWDEALGGLVGAICGSLGSAPLVAGALRRGGTRGGTALLLALAALVGAALAFVPVVGYLEAVAVPILGARLRRRSPDTHAGLRTLARD
jgi:hypothetical protein